ncbi:MAG: NF038122 family metalloprotease [Deltaproteobacteria bacterium]|nr:NF038122 family metalloprotease [Deltaproteobacteria bacterium]
MIINLIPDNSIASAPAGFGATVRSAADLIQHTFTDNITLNIRYGWGTYDNQDDRSLHNLAGAIGGAISSEFLSYSDVKAWLAAKPALPQDAFALASLPASISAFPDNPPNGFVIASAEEKALGQFSGQSTDIDGAIGFGTALTSDSWFSTALHEITHAMGRLTGVDPSSLITSDPWLFDLYRYSGPNEYQWAGGQAAYFSLDDGRTPLANFDLYSDPSDFAGDNLTPADPFNASVTPGNVLTPADISAMDVLGLTPVGAMPSSDFLPSSSNAIAVDDTSTGQSVPAAGLAYSGPVVGLRHQYIYTGQDKINVSVSDDYWFLHGGPGDDALAAHGGYNVLDGATGSNFLSGGTGADTFFVDDRSPPADIWSTVTGFHAGDDVTVFGVVPASGSSSIHWFDNQGAAGFTGLTLHATSPNQPTASLTLPGYGVSDLSDGRLSVAFGSEIDGTPFLHLTANG